jgi:hypothetical protein
MRLCGQKSPQVFVEHVRYICPILTETETAWNPPPPESSTWVFMKSMSVNLPIGPNYFSEPFTWGWTQSLSAKYCPKILFLSTDDGQSSETERAWRITGNSWMTIELLRTYRRMDGQR